MTFVGIDVGRYKDSTAYVATDNARRFIEEIEEIKNEKLSRQAEMLAPKLSRARMICIDASGLGLGLAEKLQEMELPVVSVSIVGGDAVRVIERGRVSAGKRFLIQRLRAAILSGLRVDPTGILPEVALLFRSQLSFMVAKQAKRAYKMEAAKGHDDLVLAGALAVLAGDLHLRWDTAGHG